MAKRLGHGEFEGYWDKLDDVARMAGPSPDMDAAAAKVAANLRILAALHATPEDNYTIAETVTAEPSLYGPKRILDRWVGYFHPAAASIEFGHESSGIFAAYDGYVEGLELVDKAVKASGGKLMKKGAKGD